jgi:hypothetical protein
MQAKFDFPLDKETAMAKKCAEGANCVSPEFNSGLFNKNRPKSAEGAICIQSKFSIDSGRHQEEALKNPA